MIEPTRRYAEIVYSRTVERFVQRLFLREPVVRNLCIVSPFISAMTGSRYSLALLRAKIERERIPTYVVTREPIEPYQFEAAQVLEKCPWIEVRYNPSVHAKVYVVQSAPESESFALFGSGNLTSSSIERNVELGMMIYNVGPGRDLVRELHYWAAVRLRQLAESKLVQPIRLKRRL